MNMILASETCSCSTSYVREVLLSCPLNPPLQQTYTASPPRHHQHRLSAADAHASSCYFDCCQFAATNPRHLLTTPTKCTYRPRPASPCGLLHCFLCLHLSENQSSCMPCHSTMFKSNQIKFICQHKIWKKKTDRKPEVKQNVKNNDIEC